MTNPFQIQTTDELHKLLLRQRQLTQKAERDLTDLVRQVVTPTNQGDDEYLATQLMAREGSLLERYAVLPTLSEFLANPDLRSIQSEGGTFGVSLIVGTVLLPNIRLLSNAFERVHRTLLMVMLAEFYRPVSEDSDLVDTFVRSISVEFRQDATPASEEGRAQMIHSLMAPVAEAFVLVAEKYKLIHNRDAEGWELTHLGQRVMFHLFDAQRFIDSIAEAHRRLQSTAAPFSQ